jgi:hypothetical protein
MPPPASATPQHTPRLISNENFSLGTVTLPAQTARAREPMMRGEYGNSIVVIRPRRYHAPDGARHAAATHRQDARRSPLGRRQPACRITRDYRKAPVRRFAYFPIFLPTMNETVPLKMAAKRDCDHL